MIQGKKYTFDSKNGQVILQKSVPIDRLPDTNMKLPFSIKKKKKDKSNTKVKRKVSEKDQ